MKTIAELAAILGARVEGDESQTIRAIRPLSQAGDGELAFLRSGTEPPATAEIRAMAVIVNVDTDRSLKDVRGHGSHNAGNGIRSSAQTLRLSRNMGILTPGASHEPAVDIVAEAHSYQIVA